MAYAFYIFFPTYLDKTQIIYIFSVTKACVIYHSLVFSLTVTVNYLFIREFNLFCGYYLNIVWSHENMPVKMVDHVDNEHSIDINPIYHMKVKFKWYAYMCVLSY